MRALRCFSIHFFALAAQAVIAAPSQSFAFDGDTLGWTAERGRLWAAEGKVHLQPDKNRRIVLVSPMAPAQLADGASAFAVAVNGTGLVRVRVQGRRDERSGWITLADARGNALRETADGVVVKRTLARNATPYHQLRVEMEFRTTNPRTLERIVVVPPAP